MTRDSVSLPRLAKATPGHKAVIDLEWADGTVSQVDLTKLIKTDPALAGLEDLDVFNCARVVHSGMAVGWGGEDVDPVIGTDTLAGLSRGAPRRSLDPERNRRADDLHEAVLKQGVAHRDQYLFAAFDAEIQIALFILRALILTAGGALVVTLGFAGALADNAQATKALPMIGTSLRWFVGSLLAAMLCAVFAYFAQGAMREIIPINQELRRAGADWYEAVTNFLRNLAHFRSSPTGQVLRVIAIIMGLVSMGLLAMGAFCALQAFQSFGS